MGVDAEGRIPGVCPQCRQKVDWASDDWNLHAECIAKFVEFIRTEMAMRAMDRVVNGVDD